MKRVGIIMHGVTGRMGMNQHLIRSILEIRRQGGVALKDGTRVMPDPILVGRNAAKIEIPGYRELVDATMAAQDQPARKAAFAKLQRFVIEQALQVPQFISPNIVVASPKVRNLVDNLPGTPKFTEVWLDASA